MQSFGILVGKLTTFSFFCNDMQKARFFKSYNLTQNINQPNQYGFAQPTAGSVLSQALGQQLGEVTSQLVSKNLNVAPTINIRPGYRFNIIIVKDLTFNRPYRQFAY